jgi:hypothetical protein
MNTYPILNMHELDIRTKTTTNLLATEANAHTSIMICPVLRKKSTFMLYFTQERKTVA